MKNVIKHTKKGILMVALMTASLSFANNAPTFFGKTNNVKKVWVSFNLVKVGEYLSIKDNNGAVLYKEVIKQSGFYKKGFDLTSLPNGDYIFELDKGLSISVIPFSVKTKMVKFKKEEEKIIFKPFLKRHSENTIFLTKLALNREPLNIKIYFSASGSRELMYSNNIENTKNIGKIFKLTGIGKGTYTFVMESEGRTFKETIE